MKKKSDFDKKAFHHSVPKEAKLSTKALLRHGAKVKGDQLVLTGKQIERKRAIMERMERLGLTAEKINPWAKQFIEAQREKPVLKKSGYSFRDYAPIFSFLLSIYKGKLKNKEILEIGYRRTNFMAMLKKNGAKMFGLDIEPAKTVKGMELKQGAAENLDKIFPKNQKFDAIYSSRCINAEAKLPSIDLSFARMIYGKLNKGGFLVISGRLGALNEAALKKAGFRIIVPKTEINTRYVQYIDICIA